MTKRISPMSRVIDGLLLRFDDAPATRLLLIILDDDAGLIKGAPELVARCAVPLPSDCFAPRPLPRSLLLRCRIRTRALLPLAFLSAGAAAAAADAAVVYDDIDDDTFTSRKLRRGAGSVWHPLAENAAIKSCM